MTAQTSKHSGRADMGFDAVRLDVYVVKKPLRRINREKMCSEEAGRCGRSLSESWKSTKSGARTNLIVEKLC